MAALLRRKNAFMGIFLVIGILLLLEDFVRFQRFFLTGQSSMEHGAMRDQVRGFEQDRPQNASISSPTKPPIRQLRCAINLWGLPRAFGSLVLPSLERNVIQINAYHNCDYYVHFYFLENEAAGRSGRGGHIDSNEVYQLQFKVQRIHQSHHNTSGLGPATVDHNRKPIVKFNFTTDDDFWRMYGSLLNRLRHAVDANGRHIYFPYRDPSVTFPTTLDNVIKMWHIIESSWKLMELHERRLGITYDRVAMLRIDVVYVTPVDIYETQHCHGNRQLDANNSIAVIPSFARYPVSDRLIYGPRRAVQIWATQRFQRMGEHVRWMQEHGPGFGLHSERFVNHTLLRAIREEGFSVVEHDTICFFRARADSSAWVSDCNKSVSSTLISTMGASAGEHSPLLPSASDPDDLSAVTLSWRRSHSSTINDYLLQLGATKRELMENLLGRPCGEESIHIREYAEVLHCPLSTVEHILRRRRMN
jgi:hypothetical protein